MAGYDTLYRLLELEIQQRFEEGCALDRAAWHERLRDSGRDDLDALEQMSEELAALRPQRDFPYTETPDLEAIRNIRPGGVRDMEKELPERDVFERIHGGWIGRCCGCSLGKPFDREPYTAHPEGRQRDQIQLWVEKADAWPLDFYVPASSPAERWGIEIANPGSTRESIKRMEADDNLNATLVVLENLEKNGTGFGSADVAANWLSLLPFDQASPAAAQSLANMIRDERFARRGRPDRNLEDTDWSRISATRNPYREWNGAMSRADLYGYVAPGRPEFAAEMAWRDARVSHVKNGMYAAMFVSTAIAAAFHESDPSMLVDCGLSEIPVQCRLARGVKKVMNCHSEGAAWTECWDSIMEEYGHYHHRHAIPNALMCVLALLYGEGDFARSICLAACCGLNPAGNGATVGSILGVLNGSRALPGKWVTPLNNTLRSNVLGYTEATIGDGARRCLQVLAK